MKKKETKHACGNSSYVPMFHACSLSRSLWPYVYVDAERAELLHGAVADGGAPGPAVEPEVERRGVQIFDRATVSLLELVVDRILNVGDLKKTH
jgi:hypothetical protein